MAKSNKAARHDGALFGRRRSVSVIVVYRFLRLFGSRMRRKRHRVDMPGEGFGYIERLSHEITVELDLWEKSEHHKAATPETLLDARELRAIAETFRGVAKNRDRPPGRLGLTVAVTFERIEYAIELRARWRLRVAGVEADTGAARARDEALESRRRPKIEIPRDLLESEWERAKHLKPHADKGTLRETVARQLGVSEATVKRRLKDHGIDLPKKNLAE